LSDISRFGTKSDCSAWSVSVITRKGERAMQPQSGTYPEQFTLAPNLLHVAIPRHEIIAEMSVRGDEQALDDLCLAVAVVADLIGLVQVRRPY